MITLYCHCTVILSTNTKKYLLQSWNTKEKTLNVFIFSVIYSVKEDQIFFVVVVFRCVCVDVCMYLFKHLFEDQKLVSHYTCGDNSHFWGQNAGTHKFESVFEAQKLLF